MKDKYKLKSKRSLPKYPDGTGSVGTLKLTPEEIAKLEAAKKDPVTYRQAVWDLIGHQPKNFPAGSQSAKDQEELFQNALNNINAGNRMTIDSKGRPSLESKVVPASVAQNYTPAQDKPIAQAPQAGQIPVTYAEYNNLQQLKNSPDKSAAGNAVNEMIGYQRPAPGIKAGTNAAIQQNAIFNKAVADFNQTYNPTRNIATPNAISASAPIVTGAAASSTAPLADAKQQEFIDNGYDAKPIINPVANIKNPYLTNTSPIMNQYRKGTKDVEVEKDETIFKKGKDGKFKLVEDFKGGKTHEKGGEETEVGEGDVIFPGHMRKAVIEMYKSGNHKGLEALRQTLPPDHGDIMHGGMCKYDEGTNGANVYDYQSQINNLYKALSGRQTSEQKTKAQQHAQNLADMGVNVYDAIASMDQINRSNRGLKNLQRTTQLAPMSKNADLANMLQRNRIASQQGLSPDTINALNAQNLDNFMQQKAAATTGSTGQAGTYNAMMQKAILDRYKNNRQIGVMNEQARHNNIQDYMNSIGQSMNENNHIYDQAHNNYLENLNDYYRKEQAIQHLGQTGRENLRQTLGNIREMAPRGSYNLPRLNLGGKPSFVNDPDIQKYINGANQSVQNAWNNANKNNSIRDYYNEDLYNQNIG